MQRTRLLCNTQYLSRLPADPLHPLSLSSLPINIFLLWWEAVPYEHAVAKTSHAENLLDERLDNLHAKLGLDLEVVLLLGIVVPPPILFHSTARNQHTLPDQIQILLLEIERKVEPTCSNPREVDTLVLEVVLEDPMVSAGLLPDFRAPPAPPTPLQEPQSQCGARRLPAEEPQPQ